jgi:hypothetical protein
MRPRLLAVHAAVLLVATSLAGLAVRADDVTVPIALQVDLLGRVVRFERNFGARLNQPAPVVVVEKSGEAASARAAAQAKVAIVQANKLGGRQASAVIHVFSAVAALRAAASGAAIVYLMPGFSRSEVQAIAGAFADSSVLTIAAAASDVDAGMVLGFELVSSKPRIVVNLPIARAQRLDFNAQILRLARVVQ